VTDRQRSLDLLNELHEFPTPMMIKVIGANHPTFVARVVAAVRMELLAAEDPPYSIRQTPNGRHVAITLEPLLRDAEQVLAVYACLRNIEGVVMLM